MAPTLHRVMLVEDREVMRLGLRTLLRSVDDITVVGEADSVATAVEEAQRLRPDLVIMDLKLKDGSGVEATLAIRSKLPETRVLMLSSFPEEEGLFAAILAGAAGFVLRHVRADDLIKAIRGVCEGLSMLDPTLTEAVLERVRRGTAPPADEKLAHLSVKEEQVLALIAEGKTNRQIAEELHYSERAIKKYVSSVLSKLGMSRRAEAAAYYASHRPPGGPPPPTPREPD